MKLKIKKKSRKFNVGLKENIVIKDCGSIFLDSDEQITFYTEKGGEYDLARKKWGFYATPSINGRLTNFGLRTALTKNSFGKYYIMLVEKGFEKDFFEYLTIEKIDLINWLDVLS